MMQIRGLIKRSVVLMAITLASVGWLDFVIFHEPQSPAPLGSWHFAQGLPWLVIAAFLQLLIHLRHLRSPATTTTNFLSVILAVLTLSLFIEPTRGNSIRSFQ